MEKEIEIINNPLELIQDDEIIKPEHKLVVSIVKKGYAYEVVKTANNHGGKGAIILNGRGSSQEKKSFFGMEISPEKEMIVMVVKEELVYPIIKAVYAIGGFKTNAKGVVFAMPISFLLD